MLRFNSQENYMEVFDNTEWTAVAAPPITVITDDQFNGDGSTVSFTLSVASTTAGTIVAINGVQQLPTTAYAISGTTLTFTEAPASGDVIDSRILTTTSSITALQNGNSSVGISNTNGNIVTDVNGATIITVSPGLVDIQGNLTVSGNATLSGNILGDRIQNGTTSLDIQSPNGNANISIGGTSNVAVFTTAGLNVTGIISATGNITGSYIFGNGSQLTGIDATAIQNGTSSLAVISSGGNIRGNIAGATVTTTYASGLNVTGVISANGTITGGNIATAGTITGASVSVSGTVTGTSFVGVATSAQYADLAEKYTADAEYAPGTVVSFGGAAEVTASTDADTRVAGVVSTNPAFTMNNELVADHVVTVAFTGRVPCRVTGTVRKGDLMVSAGRGLARAEAAPAAGTIIGKALANHDGAEGTIEVVVGRF
jgi:hypothetical protein